jgi:hypothetical protein
MSRTAWHALFATLRNNWYFVAFILFVAHLTVDASGIAFTHMGKSVPFGIIWFAVAFGWPLMLCLAPPCRGLLLLPLSTREVGGVMFMLRVAVPCVALLLVAAAQLALVWVTRNGLAFPVIPMSAALAICAAFPAMVLAPFLPLPSFFWRDRDPGYARGRAAMRLAAAVAVGLVAPAVALVPVLARQFGWSYGGFLSAALGAAMAALAWGLRERIVVESMRADRATGHATAALYPRGWRGIGPLFLPACGWSAAVGILVPLTLLPLRHRLSDRALAVGELAFAGSCLAYVAMLGVQKSIRALRLLPISVGALATLLTLAVTLPSLVGLVVSFCVVDRFRPELGVPLFHTTVLWAFCMACVLMAVPSAVRFGRSSATALRGAPWSVLSWFVCSGILLTRVHLPTDMSLLLAAMISIFTSYLWLRHSVATTLVRQ